MAHGKSSLGVSCSSVRTQRKVSYPSGVGHHRFQLHNHRSYPSNSLLSAYLSQEQYSPLYQYSLIYSSNSNKVDISFFSSYRKGHWNSERLNNFSKVTQLISSKVRIRLWLFGSKAHALTCDSGLELNLINRRSKLSSQVSIPFLLGKGRSSETMCACGKLWFLLRQAVSGWH